MAASDVQRKLTAIGVFACICVLLLPKGAVARSNPQACSQIASEEALVIEFPARTRTDEATPLKGVLMKPQGKGPFPALVILHRNFGIEAPYCYRKEQRLFMGMGYASLLLDSDSIADSARTGFYSTGGYTHADQGRDAHAAKAFLARLPFVNPRKIGVLGYAYGGGAALRAAYAPLAQRFEREGTFAVAIAFHPFCFEELASIAIPLLIVNGDKDQVNPAKHCRALRRRAKTTEEFRLLTFPGVGHNFDVAWLPTFDEKATSFSYARVREFLKRHLR